MFHLHKTCPRLNTAVVNIYFIIDCLSYVGTGVRCTPRWLLSFTHLKSRLNWGTWTCDLKGSGRDAAANAYLAAAHPQNSDGRNFGWTNVVRRTNFAVINECETSPLKNRFKACAYIRATIVYVSSLLHLRHHLKISNQSRTGNRRRTVVCALRSHQSRSGNKFSQQDDFKT